jgi:hypothetical protein
VSDLRLLGVGASPYTRKLRAALRFRRIPYRFVIVGSSVNGALDDTGCEVLFFQSRGSNPPGDSH